jgi:hypothetical protein
MFIAHVSLAILAATAEERLGSVFLDTKFPLFEDQVLLDTSKDFLTGAVLFFEVTNLISAVGFNCTDDEIS